MKMICLLTILLALFCDTATAKIVDGIAALVNDEVIMISELRNQLKTQQISHDKYEGVLGQMIEQALIASEIKKRGLSATENEIDQAIAKIRQQNGIQSNFELIKRLEEQGLTLTIFRKGLKDQIERSKFVNYVMGTKIKISEQDIRQYYNTEYLKQDAKKQYRLRNIFVKEKSVIDQIHAQLRNGSDFGKMAKEKSEMPNAEQEGLLGDFELSELQESFANATKILAVGKFSDPIKTSDGFNILYLEKMVSKGKKSLKNATDEIRQILTANESDRLFQAWLRQARQKAFVDIRINNSEEI